MDERESSDPLPMRSLNYEDYLFDLPRKPLTDEERLALDKLYNSMKEFCKNHPAPVYLVTTRPEDYSVPVNISNYSPSVEPRLLVVYKSRTPVHDEFIYEFNPLDFKDDSV